MKINKYIFIVLIFIQTIALGQQDAMFTHYMFSTALINPAFSGSTQGLTLVGMNRIQWVTFDGAPTTQAVSLHSPIFTKNNGLGLSISNDISGPQRTSGIVIDYSYKLNITENSGFALGLKAGTNVMNIKLSELGINDETDPAFNTDIESKILPNFGFGTYYYNEFLFIGFSIPKLLKNDFHGNTFINLTNGNSEESLHYYILGGATFKLSETVSFKPSFLIKTTNAAPTEMDLSGLLYFSEKFWAGAMLRTGDAIGILVGMRVSEQIQIGYAYDFSYGLSTLNYNGGSHEIMLKYSFIYRQKNTVTSPRHFSF